jgi:hypothetical protein
MCPVRACGREPLGLIFMVIIGRRAPPVLKVVARGLQTATAPPAHPCTPSEYSDHRVTSAALHVVLFLHWFKNRLFH